MESYGEGFPQPSVLEKLLWVSSLIINFAFMANCKDSFNYDQRHLDEGWGCWVRSVVWLIVSERSDTVFSRGEFQDNWVRGGRWVSMASSDVEDLVVRLDDSLEITSMDQEIKLVGEVLTEKTLNKWRGG